MRGGKPRFFCCSSEGPISCYESVIPRDVELVACISSTHRRTSPAVQPTAFDAILKRLGKRPTFSSLQIVDLDSPVNFRISGQRSTRISVACVGPSSAPNKCLHGNNGGHILTRYAPMTYRGLTDSSRPRIRAGLRISWRLSFAQAGRQSRT